LATVRAVFFAAGFFAAGCPERFDEAFFVGRAFAPGRFFVTVARDLVLAGDLRAGFLTMVILTSR
jgi:hypothetical protein